MTDTLQYLASFAIGFSVGLMIWFSVRYFRTHPGTAAGPPPVKPVDTYKVENVSEYQLRAAREDAADKISQRLSKAYNTGKASGFGAPIGTDPQPYRGQSSYWSLNDSRVTYDPIHEHEYRSQVAGWREGQRMIREQLDARLAEIKEAKR